MARITVEDCLTKETNRFGLVLLASKRAKQILEGAPSLISSKNKAVVTALREIAAGKVHFMSDEEMAKQKEQQKIKDQEMLVKEQNGNGVSMPENGHGITFGASVSVASVLDESSEDSDESDDDLDDEEASNDDDDDSDDDDEL